jgi:hypothetical protein
VEFQQPHILLQINVMAKQLLIQVSDMVAVCYSTHIQFLPDETIVPLLLHIRLLSPPAGV